MLKYLYLTCNWLPEARAQRRNQVKFVKLEVSAYICYLNLWELGKTTETENANKEKTKDSVLRQNLEVGKRIKLKRERKRKSTDKNGRKIWKSVVTKAK